MKQFEQQNTLFHIYTILISPRCAFCACQNVRRKYLAPWWNMIPIISRTGILSSVYAENVVFSTAWFPEMKLIINYLGEKVKIRHSTEQAKVQNWLISHLYLELNTVKILTIAFSGCLRTKHKKPKIWNRNSLLFLLWW